jgi:hypothetical protein
VVGPLALVGKKQQASMAIDRASVDCGAWDVGAS